MSTRQEEGTKMTVDPYLLAVIRGRFQEIADEMAITHIRAALGPLISEAIDQAQGIYREAGDLVAQGRMALPIFIETMQESVKIVRKAALARGMISEGDIFIMNTPYGGGSHLNDVKLFKPVFRKGKHLLWVGNTGHWPDIGGAASGGFPFGINEIHPEGVMIPPVKIYDKGKMNEDVFLLLLENVREKEERYGDIKAGCGALNIGEQRLHGLFDKYGEDTVMACLDELEDRAEMHTRSYISEIPDGEYSYADYMDNDGITDEPIKIGVTITVRGDEMVVDFSETDPPCKGIQNCSYGLTCSSVYTCLKHVFPDIPITAGMFRPVKLLFRKGVC